MFLKKLCYVKKKKISINFTRLKCSIDYLNNFSKLQINCKSIKYYEFLKTNKHNKMDVYFS